MERQIEVDEKSLRLLVTALRQESDGKALTRDLVRELTLVAEPARDAARTAILSMASHGPGGTPSLRTSVASRTVVQVRLSKGSVAVRAKRSGMPRGFSNAPKRLNSAKGWRRRVFGSDNWVVQMGQPGWFDNTMKAFSPAAKRGAKKAMDDMADRISIKTKG